MSEQSTVCALEFIRYPRKCGVESKSAMRNKCSWDIYHIFDIYIRIIFNNSNNISFLSSFSSLSSFSCPKFPRYYQIRRDSPSRATRRRKYANTHPLPLLPPPVSGSDSGFPSFPAGHFQRFRGQKLFTTVQRDGESGGQ